MKKLFFILIIMLGVATACSRNELPQRPEDNTDQNGGSESHHPQPPVPDNPIRPGNGTTDIERELADTVYRFVGNGLAMRYTDGGILFSRPDNRLSWAITNLDGNDHIEFTPGVVKPDSLLPASSLIVNGRPIPLITAKIAATSQNARWHILLTTDSSSIIIVTPLP